MDYLIAFVALTAMEIVLGIDNIVFIAILTGRLPREQQPKARRLGPDGVHVAYLAIDAVIDVPWTRKAFADRPDSFFCQPAAIAEECWHLVHQPRSAWTFDALIRPHGEVW